MARTLTQAGPERTNRLIFMGAVLLAAIAAVLVFVALSNFGGEDDSGSFSGAVDVVVASQSIGANTKITADMVEIASVPSSATVDGYLTDEDAVLGSTLFVPLVKGDQLSTAKLVEGATEGKVGLPYVVDPGKRGISFTVQADKIVGGNLRAGDRVDVIFTGDVEFTNLNIPDEEDQKLVSKILFQDIEVLAVAGEALEPIVRYDEDGNPIKADSENPRLPAQDPETNDRARTVTLELDPTDVPLLTLAAEGGSVYLALRPAGAGDTVEAPFITGLGQ